MELPQDERPAQTNRQGDAPFQNGFSRTSDVCGNKLTGFNNKENHRAKIRKCKPDSEAKKRISFVISLAPHFQFGDHTPDIDRDHLPEGVCPKNRISPCRLCDLRVSVLRFAKKKIHHGGMENTEK